MAPRAETLFKLLTEGTARVNLWCDKNHIERPGLKVLEREQWRFGVCAYYRPKTTRICLDTCATYGYAARAWSWPGYVIDRTPYGVVAHELGHHVDWLKSELKGNYYGDLSAKLRRASKEDKLTNYCPNDAEWFAEMFRLFVTNADLLSKLRPRTYAAFREKGFEPADEYPWRQVLSAAPARTTDMAQKKINAVSGVLF